MALSETNRRILLELAARSIGHGLKTHQPLPLEFTAFPAELQAHGATFVTLELRGALQGCIGMLHATRPLAVDVARNAYAAAFKDPRGRVLTENDLGALSIHISLLSPPEPMSFISEEDLLAQLRPGDDGLILEEGANRGTLLPAVWKTIPDRRAFVNHVKLKAGLPGNYWSNTLQASRYTAEYFGN